MITPFHAKYYAHELMKKSVGDSLNTISKSLFDAAVDVNPHQVDAALFAFKSPLSKGVLLADEVGLGKTIEAGLVVCQYWAERKRRIIVICPASLRKQWSLELSEKFNIQNTILEARNFNENLRDEHDNPFEQDAVVIVSYNFAVRKKEYIRAVKWDIAVIDEAHKLRNVYRASNVTGQAIKWALGDTKKLLLTATPLQNSLLELYGLSTLISDHIFGDLKAFRENYIHDGGDLAELRDRLKGFCKRTLREDVSEYIRYTQRYPITQKFSATDAEQALYEAISEFLQREDTYAIPKSQKTLTTLIIRKILASSTRAVIQTLETVKRRLVDMLNTGVDNDLDLTDILDEDEAEIVSEFMEEEEISELTENIEAAATSDSEIKLEKIKKEINEIDSFIELAYRVKKDSKSEALLIALDKGFLEMKRLGAKKKALIFTESRRTQEYLKSFLEANGYAGKIVLYNGSNNDQQSNQIYTTWVENNKKTGRVSGIKSADKRAALVEYFRDTAEIMLATESAAEGINLQFCSLVVNYDLPWNPQRIEQRIGRCHRYGQGFDVVVVNFVNERNHADVRVFQLLEEKFNLFKGVFGTSDEVLGSIESGVDFEKRVLEIYQTCRKPEEIEAKFNELQREMEQSIQQRMDKTRKVLLENFDVDVHERLKFNLENAREYLYKYERLFWNVTKYILREYADFNDHDYVFNLTNKPDNKFATGMYHLISKERANPGGIVYRLSHPLGEYVIDQALNVKCEVSKIRFDSSNKAFRIAVIEQMKDQAGWLMLSKVTIESFDKEEHLLFTAFDEEGRFIDQDICEKMFLCEAIDMEPIDVTEPAKMILSENMQRYEEATISQVIDKNNSYFKDEQERLQKWADDMIQGTEKALESVKRQIREWQRKARLATKIDEQHEIQLHISELEKEKNKLRREIFRQEDEINEKRDLLISELEKRLQQKTSREDLFMIRWEIA